MLESEDSLRRLANNPLRILDSKNSEMEALIEGAPKIIDHLDDESKEHFSTFKNYLECLEIPYSINPRLVRGLDYYNRTVFEWISNDLGAQGTICGGGRYDGLVEKMGGNPTPAIGFAIGIERLILLIKKQSSKLQKNKPHLYFAALGESSQMASIKLSRDIHSILPDIIITNDMNGGSLKSQMKKANKSNADFALILGEEELSSNQLSIKPLKGQGDQHLIKVEGIIQHLQEIL